MRLCAYREKTPRHTTQHKMSALTDALNVVTEAVKLDEAGHFAAALQLYERALTALTAASRTMADAKRAIVQEKINGYSARVAEIRGILARKSQSSGAPTSVPDVPDIPDVPDVPGSLNKFVFACAR
jgi:hypothetical protein